MLGKDYEAFQAIEIHNKLLKAEKEEKNKQDLINERNKPKNIKDLSLLDKIPKDKNIYPEIDKNKYPEIDKNIYPEIDNTQNKSGLEVTPNNGNVKKINFGWQRTQIPLPEIEIPKPSAPPAPELFSKNFSKFNRHFSCSSDDDVHIEC